MLCPVIVILFLVLWIPFVDRQQHFVMSATKKMPASKPRCQDSEQIELPLPLAYTLQNLQMFGWFV